jgi:O-methyltransferase involved in polyketide biosynthesis
LIHFSGRDRRRRGRSDDGTGKVGLTKGNETYLATLYSKAMDVALENPILGDRFAADAVR